jgi:hypothetical protein
MRWCKIDAFSQDNETFLTVVNNTLHCRVPHSAGNFLTTSEPVSFSRVTPLQGVNFMSHYLQDYH